MHNNNNIYDITKNMMFNNNLIDCFKEEPLDDNEILDLIKIEKDYIFYIENINKKLNKNKILTNDIIINGRITENDSRTKTYEYKTNRTYRTKKSNKENIRN